MWYHIKKLVEETISSLVMNAFVCSVILYFEASIRHFLNASNERVHLQCNIVFGGDPGLPRLPQTIIFDSPHKLLLLHDIFQNLSLSGRASKHYIVLALQCQIRAMEVHIEHILVMFTASDNPLAIFTTLKPSVWSLWKCANMRCFKWCCNIIVKQRYM